MNRDNSSCKRTLEVQMLLKKSIRKAKFILHKTLRNLKTFQCGGYGKLPKVPPFDLFIHRGSQKSTNVDQSSCRDFSQQWDSEEMQSDNTSVLSKEWPSDEYSNFNGGGPTKPEKKIAVNIKDQKKEKKTGSFREGSGRNLSSRDSREGSYVLAQKMKELEMMDTKDVDHVLDIEEVLYYYSHLKSPVYRDIVDQFFVDMHSEFILPKPTSVTVGNSSRRLGNSSRRNSSQRLGNSSRRLGPLKL